MDKAQKIKNETKLIVNDGEPINETDSPEGKIAEVDLGKVGDKSVVSASEAPRIDIAKVAEVSIDREQRNRNDQKFIQAYEKQQLIRRIWFAAIAFALTSAIALPIRTDSQDHNFLRSLAQFSPVLALATLGERDVSYHEIANVPLGKGNRASQLDGRKHILDRAISDMENSGHDAILSRLGAEQLLIRAGDRKGGLKYGETLIAKYPNAPANYAWLAQVDFNRKDFAHSIESYKTFAALLEHSTPDVQHAWCEELPKAVEACTKLGREEEALQFLKIYEKYGGDEYFVRANRFKITSSRSHLLKRKHPK